MCYSRLRWRTLCLAGLLFGIARGAVPFDVPVEDTAQGKPATVVAYHPRAREIGERILASGGNAADAFVATTFAENILAEGASSLAGPLGVMVYCAETCKSGHPGDPAVIYLDADFNHPLSANQRWTPGKREYGKAVLVPGAPLGLAELARKYGSMEWSSLIQPAIDLAEEGFPVNTLMAGFLKWRKRTLERTEYGKRTFFRNGKPLRVGDLLRQPEAAAFLRSLAAEGPDYVYRGAWAEQFLGAVKAAGGDLGVNDLTNYSVRWTPPWSASYRGHTVYAASGASFGGIWVLLAMKVWEHATVSADARYWSDPEVLEYMIRTTHQVWSEPYLLDHEALTHTDLIRSRLTSDHAAAIWDRVQKREKARPMGVGGPHSYHIVARDKHGNIVSGTTTIESAPWGDGIFVQGVPLTTAGMIPWGSEPGKRRISPLTMQFVFRDGVPLFVVGTISNSLLEAAFQLLVNLIDYGMPVTESVSVPRFGTFPTGSFWRGRPLLLDRNMLDPRIPREIVKSLKRNGLKVVQSGVVDTGLGAVLSVAEPGAQGVALPIPYVSRPFEEQTSTPSRSK